MGTAYNIVSQYIPFVRKKPSLSRNQALQARPVKNPNLEWNRVADCEIKLIIPRRTDFLGRTLCKMFHAPDHKEIILDEVGSDIWELCDGNRSVEAIVAAVSKKYKMTRRECETSVGMYLKMLGDRNLLGLQVGGRRKK